jgi:hypothetical protein
MVEIQILWLYVRVWVKMVSKLIGVRGHDAAILCATPALEDANSHCDLFKNIQG